MANLLLPRLLPENSTSTQPPVITQGALPVIEAPQVMPNRVIKYPLPYNPNYVYQKPKNYLSNYNDPNEINSIADVIAHSITDYANPITEMIDLFKRTTLDPIRAGQWGVAGINNLINFSETMDIVAAPAKALLQGQGFAGAAGALGFGNIDGRQNYDWNTGALCKDFVYEMLSDPLNWLTLGVKGIVTAGAKKAVKEGIEAVAYSSAVTMENKLYKKIVHQTLDAYYNHDLVEFAKQTEKLVKHFEGKGKIVFPKVAGKTTVDQVREFSEAIAKADSISKENVGFQINKSLNKLSNTTENVERAMLKAALSPVVFPSWWVAKQGFSKAYRMIENRIRVESLPFLREDKAASFTKWDRILKVADKANTFAMMQQLKLDPSDVPRHFFTLLQDGARKDTLAISNLFKDYYNNPLELERKITEYMQKFNEVDSLQTYAQLVQEISKSCDNVFSAEAETFMNFIKRLDELKNAKAAETIATSIPEAQRQFTEAQVELIKLFSPPDYSEIDDILEYKLKEIKELKLDGMQDSLDLKKESDYLRLRQGVDSLKKNDINNIAETLRDEFNRRAKRLGVIDAKKQAGLRDRIYRDTLAPYLSHITEQFYKYVEQNPRIPRSDLERAFQSWQRSIEKRFDGYIMHNSRRHNSKELARTFELPDVTVVFQKVFEQIKNALKTIKEFDQATIKQEIELDMDRIYLKLLADKTEVKAANKIYNKLASKLDTSISRSKQTDKIVYDATKVDAVKQEVQKYFDTVFEDNLGAVSDSATASARLMEYTNNFLEAVPNTKQYEGAHYGLQNYLQGEQHTLKESIKDFPGETTLILERIEGIEELLDKLKKVSPTEVRNATMKLDDFTKLVRVKMEAFRTSMELSDKGYIGDLIRSINDTNNPIGNFVQQYAKLDELTKSQLEKLGAEGENMHTACKELYDIAQLNNDYVMFINSVAAREDINQTMKSAFFATVQNMWHVDPKLFLENPEKAEELFKSMQIHLMSIKSDDKYNLDYFWATRHEWGKNLPEEVMKDLEAEAVRHTAYGDAKLDAILMDTLHPDLLKDYEDTFIMFGDSETTHTKELLQLALTDRSGHKIWECTRKMLYETAVDKCPNEDVLRLMYPDADPMKLKEAFLSDPRYVTNNPDEVVSEYELLSQFLEQLSRSNPLESPEKNTLIFHNGNGFDYPVIEARLKEHGLSDRYYKQANRLDSMDMMLSKNAEVYVTAAVRENLEQELTAYALKLYARGSRRMINNRSGDLLAQLRKIDGIFKSGYFPEDSDNFAGVLSKVTTELDSVLGATARNNKELGLMYISDPFACITPETREVFIEREAALMGLTPNEYRTKYGYNAEDVFKAADILEMSPEDVRVVFKDNITLNRILSGRESLSPLTYKNEMIKKLMLDFFHIPTNVELPQKLLQVYYNVSKRLSKDISYIRNPYGIERLRSQIDEAFKKIPEHLTDDFYKMMRLDTPDVTSRFIILKYLFGATLYPEWKRSVNKLKIEIIKLKNMKGVNNKTQIHQLEQQLKTMMNGDVPWPDYIPVALKDILLDSSGIYRATLYGQEVCTDEVLSRRMGTGLFAEASLFHEYVKQFSRQGEKLKDLAKELGRNLDNKLGSANMYAVADAQMPMQRILDRMDLMSVEERLVDVAHQHTMYNDMGMQQLLNLLRKTLVDPQHLLSTLVWETPCIQFGLRQMDEYMIEFKALIEELQSKAKDLKESGIHILEHADRMYLYLDLDKNLIDTTLIRDKLGKHTEVRTLNKLRIPKPTHNELVMRDLLSPETMSDFREVRKNLETLSKGNSIGSTGEILTPTKFTEYYGKFPLAVQKALGSIDKITNQEFWKSMHYDWCNLGTAESKKFANKYGFLALTEVYKNSLQFTAAVAESKALYTNMYFDSQFSINMGSMSVEGLSKAEANQVDLDLIEALKINDEFILAALEKDSNSVGEGYRVIQIKPNTVEDMAYARKMNAVVIPYQVYATSMQSINTTRFSSEFLNFWHKIIYTYKVGYLLDPGVILRNYVDSTGKNLVADDMNIREVGHTQYRAMRLLAKYDKALNNILEHNQHVFNYDNVHTFFNRYNTDQDFTEDQFKYIHGFICYSASAGLTGPWQKYLKEKNFGDIDEHSVWNTFVAMSDKLMGPNKYVEQINRLTQHMILEEKGYTKTKIFHEIAKTHFDYNVKTRAEMYAELIFPFYTFTMRNMEFWIKGVMEHPWLASMFKDIMTPIWNFDGLSKDELGRNRSLQYQLLAGNVPLNDQGLTLKLNPSYMDVYNILMDMPQALIALSNPDGVDKVHLGTIQGKMAAPFQLGASQLLQTQGAMASGLFDTSIGTMSGQENIWAVIQANMPVFGAIQTRFQLGPKYAERTGQNWQTLPLTQGTFGGTQRWDKPKKYAKHDNSATDAYYKTGRNYRYYGNYYNKRWDDYDSFYRKHYTKKGVSKFKMRMMPYSPQNLAYRIKDLYWYFR